MDRTIGQFLDFARPSSAQQAATQPLELTQRAAKIAARYGERLSCRFGQSCWVGIRPDALQRALTNLIENALRHGAPPVELVLTREEKFCVVTVLDRGPGIPPAQVARLMQPFTRGETARTRASGAGLGLAIVERIVRAHGGRLELKEREGGGLAARLMLPALPKQR